MEGAPAAEAPSAETVPEGGAETPAKPKAARTRTSQSRSKSKAAEKLAEAEA